MILLIDNYDSFSYNLYQMMGQISPDIKVVRNDQITISEIEKLSPSHLVISPGPGYPANAGICEQAILHFAGKMPILGICLGHQAICEAFGSTISHASKLMHGKKSSIHIANGNELFHGLPPLMEGARYHSLAAERETLSKELLIIAEDDKGEIMGVKHKDYDIYGLQFHPESILTPLGNVIIENFIGMRP